MIDVALITNWQDTCGIAVYGENLVKYADEEVFYHVVPPSNEAFALATIEECSIIHINFHEGLRFGFDVPSVIQKGQKPAILTNHTAEYTNSWYPLLTRLVTHMPVGNSTVIHHGILDLELGEGGPDALVMGQAGFPFRWKNYHKMCSVANKLYELGIPGGVGLYFVIPDSYHGSATDVINECKTILNPNVGVEFETGWLSDVEVIQKLHDNASVMVYYTEEKREGPSGSVRMGIAAKRPVVVNGRAYQYQDIINEEGIYPVLQGDDELVEIVMKAHYGGNYASNLIAKDNFTEIGRQYKELYKEVLSEDTNHRR